MTKFRDYFLRFLFVTSTLLPVGVAAKTVHYELKISKGQINLSGHKTVDWALMVNQSIPAPTLEFTEGDDAEIVVTNQLLDEEVSLHWHGILLPSEMDGVPYVSNPPIHPGQSFTFRFKIRQHGTYWYHSHTMVQEQKGVYGAFIIHPKEKKIAYDKEVTVVLSDWSDEDANQIIKNLRKDGDYYLYKKNSVRSWWGAIQAQALGDYLHNEWTRMGGMDLSDVGYDAFLLNGQRDSQLLSARRGEKIRLRIINASASSYFYVSLGQLSMKVISADGIDIQPVMAKELLMGMAETYDVLFEVPDNKNYELRATAQDVTGYASGWIGTGERVVASSKPPPNLYASMDHGTKGAGQSHENHSTHSAHSEHAAHASGDRHGVIESLTVDDLKAVSRTDFSKSASVYDLKLVLGGDMHRYVWHINGKAIHQDRTIEIREGDVVRFTFQNDTMMHHPMHLHGHFFRVLNSNNEYSPLKHTVDVPPHGARTIEFLANEPGEWMLHCHNLYHMKTGMARVVKYSSYTPKPEIVQHQQHDPHLHDHLYVSGRLEAATNHAQVGLRLSKTWDTLDAHFETREYNDLDHAEGDVFYRRWISNYASLIFGGTYFAEFEKDKTRGVLGVGYVLPMLIESNLLVDHTGHFRLDLEKRFQWTRSLFSQVHASFREQVKTEFEISLMYGPSWNWAAGIMVTEDRAGVGFNANF